MRRKNANQNSAINRKNSPDYIRSAVRKMGFEKQMYIIATDDNGTPFLANGSVLLFYSRKEDACTMAQKYSKMYNGCNLQVFQIDDIVQYVGTMRMYDICSYILDGGPAFDSLKRYMTRNVDMEQPFTTLENITSSQPVRKKAQEVKKILLKRDFSAYSICCFTLSLLACAWLSLLDNVAALMEYELFAFIIAIVMSLSAIGYGAVSKSRANNSGYSSPVIVTVGIFISVVCLLATIEGLS